MKKLFYIVLIMLLAISVIGCGKEEVPETEADYRAALDSISFDFDRLDIHENKQLPATTPKFNLSIAWKVKTPSVDSSDPNFISDCTSISTKDGVSTLQNLITYDGDYDSKLWGEAVIIASVMNSDKEEYIKEFRVVFYEKDPNLNFDVNMICKYCVEKEGYYVETTAEIYWAKKANDNHYNMIIDKDGYRIYVANASYNSSYKLKAGYQVKVKGFATRFNGFCEIAAKGDVEASVSLAEKGKSDADFKDAQEIDINDFTKFDTEDTSINAILVKVHGTLNTNDGANPYKLTSGDVTVLINAASFNNSDYSSDSSHKKLDKNVGKEITISCFILYKEEGLWNIIVLPDTIE